MKRSFFSVFIAVVAATTSPLKLDFVKKISSGLEKRDGSIEAPLYQTSDHNSYLVNISIGTPPQPLSLTLDTGSSDLWVPSVIADPCRNNGCNATGAYDPTDSSSFSLLGNGTFSITYGDGSQAGGSYISDTVNLGQTQIQNMTIGLAQSTGTGLGILGIGYPADESTGLGSQFPTIVGQLKQNGEIEREAYSIWLNDFYSNTGSILFGGIDTTKYHGDLISVPVFPNAASTPKIRVDLTAISINDDSGTHTVTADNTSAPAHLDSGTSFILLPAVLLDPILTGLGATGPTLSSNVYAVPCTYLSSNASLTFHFGGSDGPAIDVPLTELIKPPQDNDSFVDNNPACILGMREAYDGDIILGDSFFRSAYVVIDLENNEVALAQTKYNATDAPDVQVIPSGTGFPGVSSNATATATPTTIPVDTASSDGPTSTVGGSDFVEGTPTFMLGSAATARPTSSSAGTSAGGSSAPSSTGGKPTKGAAATNTVLEPAILLFAVLSSLVCGFGGMVL